MKLENRQCDYVEGKSNGFEALEDLHEDLHAWNEKENKWILIYKVMHPGSEMPPDKHIEEQKAANKVAGRGSSRGNKKCYFDRAFQVWFKCYSWTRKGGEFLNHNYHGVGNWSSWNWSYAWRRLNQWSNLLIWSIIVFVIKSVVVNLQSSIYTMV